MKIPNDPMPGELVELLAECSNNIARLAELCADYQTALAYKQTALKREQAKAAIKYSAARNASLMKAQVELDEGVIKAQDEYDAASATYQLAKAEMESYESHFIALRKIVEMRKAEIQGGV